MRWSSFTRTSSSVRAASMPRALSADRESRRDDGIDVLFAALRRRWRRRRQDAPALPVYPSERTGRTNGSYERRHRLTANVAVTTAFTSFSRLLVSLIP